MNFLDLLEIKQYLFALTRSPINDDYFPCLKIEQAKLFIFANRYSSCRPNQLLDHLSHYQLVELEVQEQIKDNMIVVSPLTDLRYKMFDWSKYFAWDDGGVKRASYRGYLVPVEELPQIIRDIYKVQQFKSFY